MVLNPDKSHFLTLSFNKPFPDFSLENTIIKKVTEEKILEIVISYEKDMCTTPTQKKKLINSLINAQFTYCPLIWMFSSK